MIILWIIFVINPTHNESWWTLCLVESKEFHQCSLHDLCDFDIVYRSLVQYLISVACYHDIGIPSLFFGGGGWLWPSSLTVLPVIMKSVQVLWHKDQYESYLVTLILPLDSLKLWNVIYFISSAWNGHSNIMWCIAVPIVNISFWTTSIWFYLEWWSEDILWTYFLEFSSYLEKLIYVKMGKNVSFINDLSLM